MLLKEDYPVMTNDLKLTKKDFYLGNFNLYFYSMLGALFLNTFMSLSLMGKQEVSSLVYALLGFPLFIWAVIYYMIIVYRIWKYVIAKSQELGLTPAVSSPGKAVGFLFIPFFNFYWLFYSFIGLVNSINAIRQNQNSGKNLSKGLPIAIGVMTILGYIPVINLLISPIGACILQPLFVYKLMVTCKEIEYKSRGVADPFEGVSLAGIKDYREIFNQKVYGINFPVAVAFLMAQIVGRLLPQVWLSISYGVMFQFIKISFMATIVFVSLLTTVLFLLISHLVRKIWLLPLLFGVAGALMDVILKLVIAFTLRHYDGQFPIITIHETFFAFLAAAVFMLGLMGAIRLWGVRWWSLAVGIFIPIIIVLLLSGMPFYAEGFGLEVLREIIQQIIRCLAYGGFLYVGINLYFNNKTKLFNKRV